METVSSNGIATPPKRPEVHVSIHDRGLGLARAIVARRIILPKHLQGRLGDTTGEAKGSEENRGRRNPSPRKGLLGENRSTKKPIVL